MCRAKQTNIACLQKEASGAVSVVCQHYTDLSVSSSYKLPGYLYSWISEWDKWPEQPPLGMRRDHLLHWRVICLLSDRIGNKQGRSSDHQEVCGTAPLTKEKREMAFFPHTWTNMDVYSFQMWAEIKVLTSRPYWAWEGTPVAETSQITYIKHHSFHDGSKAQASNIKEM